jgi:hypothetical protein
MPWVKLPITGPAFRNTSEIEVDQRNAFLMDVMVNELGDTVKRPGLQSWVNLGTTNGVDGLFWWDEQNVLMAVSGGGLYKVTDAAGTFTVMGGATVPVGNKVSFANNGSTLLYTNGGRIATTTLAGPPAYISDSDAPTATRVVLMHDQYAIAPLVDQGQFQISEVGDINNWRAQDVFTAESKPDIIQNALVTRDGLLFFGKESTEFWVNDGVSPFSRVRGLTVDRGCGAPYTVVRHGDEWFWLDDQRIVVRGSMQGIQEIQNPYRREFQDLITTEDGHAHIMTIDGWPSYVLTFPTANRTYVYNLTQNDWCEWGFWDVNTAQYRRYIGNSYAFAKQWGFHVVGDYATGKLYKMTREVFTDNGDIIRSIRRTGFITHNTSLLKRSTRIRLRLRRGVANSTVASPKMLMRWREKNGAWSNMRELSLGEVGQHDVWLETRLLGMYHARQYEFIHSDATDWVLADGEEYIDVMTR